MDIVNIIVKKLNDSIKKFGKASLVLSGGKSPINIYEQLSNCDIPWSKIQITLVDDRLVDFDHIHSNQKLINDFLLKNKAKNANFYPLTEDLFQKVNIKMPFDIQLLGMGEDGHFASLFPDMIGENDAFNIFAKHKIFTTSSKGVPCLPRITMNLSLILKSEIIILLIDGKIKQKILEKAKTDDSYPIHYLLKNRKKDFFIEIMDD